MPLNAACLEGKSKEFAFTGFNDVAFGCINHQLQAVTQESADTIEHMLIGTAMDPFRWRRNRSTPFAP